MARWGELRPELDVSPMGVVGRMLRIADQIAEAGPAPHRADLRRVGPGARGLRTARQSGIQSKVSGFGPIGPASPRSSALIADTSSGLSEKSKISKFSRIRSSRIDLGNTMSPRS